MFFLSCSGTKNGLIWNRTCTGEGSFNDICNTLHPIGTYTVYTYFLFPVFNILMMGNIIFITNQTKMQLQSGLFSVSEVFLSLLCSCK